MAFFASPAKLWLVQRLSKRNHTRIDQTPTQEPVAEPTLGMPVDPMGDIEEALTEIKQEVEARRRRGSKVTMPIGQELKVAVEQKLGRKL
jgi:lysophospholipid acyltransferase